jgi:hypothetical protein
MKGIGKVLFCITVGALFFLLYVHEQVALLHVSYQIESRSEKLIRLSEESRQLRFEVEQLKAPRLLDEKMKQMSLDLTLPQEIRVIRVPESALSSESSLQKISTRPMVGRLTDFFGRFVDVAQAKTDN